MTIRTTGKSEPNTETVELDEIALDKVSAASAVKVFLKTDGIEGDASGETSTIGVGELQECTISKSMD